MGLIFSRQNGGVEEVDSANNNAYKYPPKSGNYFASHFIMGGERFETTLPEAYLFGDNSDLNYLGGRPTPFPYPAPQPNEPTRPLRCLVNIRKESLRFVRVTDTSTPENASSSNPVTVDTKATAPSEGGQTAVQIVPKPQILSPRYNIEFILDTDVRCAVTIHYFCVEEITPNGITYKSRFPQMSSETYHFKRGANQLFQQVSHVFEPAKFNDAELSYSADMEHFPVVIQCQAEEGDEPRQQHLLLAVVERSNSTGEGGYLIKPLKQKLFVDGLCYLLQEIYGIENKSVSNVKPLHEEEDIEECGCECVICMSDTRDTLILPCRHLCLCSGCADSLRYQANNCPICRAPFRALLQIRAVRKAPLMPAPRHPPVALSPTPLAPSATDNSPQDLPPGYEPLALIEALNGPSATYNGSRSSPLPRADMETPPSKGNKRMHRHKSNSASSLRHCKVQTAAGTGNTQTPAAGEIVVSALVTGDTTRSGAQRPSSDTGRGHRTSAAKHYQRSSERPTSAGNEPRVEEVPTPAERTRLLQRDATLGAATTMPLPAVRTATTDRGNTEGRTLMTEEEEEEEGFHQALPAAPPTMGVAALRGGGGASVLERTPSGGSGSKRSSLVLSRRLSDAQDEQMENHTGIYPAVRVVTGSGSGGGSSAESRRASEEDDESQQLLFHRRKMFSEASTPGSRSSTALPLDLVEDAIELYERSSRKSISAAIPVDTTTPISHDAAAGSLQQVIGSSSSASTSGPGTPASQSDFGSLETPAVK